MYIDHVGVFVKDLEKTKSFFMKYFHATASALYHNPKTQLKTYFLSFPFGSKLEIMTKPNHNLERQIDSLGYHHIAFLINTRSDLDRLTQTLIDDGYLIIKGPRVTGDGYYETLFEFDHLLIELMVR